MAELKKLTYEETDAIVLGYQAEETGSASKLYNAFEGYLVQFVNLVNKGTLDISHRGQREFLSLYIKDSEIRSRIHKYKKANSAQRELYKMASSLREFFQSYNREEIMHEATLALLTLGKRYKSPDGKPRFHAYIQKAFPYQFQRQLRVLVSDPAVFGHNNTYSYNDEFSMIEDDGSTETYEAFGMCTIEQALDEVDENWINGLTCSEIFLELNPFERRILKMYYLDDLTQQEIADVTGVCRATINRRLKGAVARLKGEGYGEEE